MNTFGKITKTVLAVAVTGALVAPATAAFAGEKTDRAIIGAVLGGAALGATTARDKYDDRRYGYEHRYAPRYDNGRYDNGRYAYDAYGRRYDRYDARYDRYDNRYDARYDNRYAYGYRR
jgi:hypothetical protein